MWKHHPPLYSHWTSVELLVGNSDLESCIFSTKLTGERWKQILNNFRPITCETHTPKNIYNKKFETKENCFKKSMNSRKCVLLRAFAYKINNLCNEYCWCHKLKPNLEMPRDWMNFTLKKINKTSVKHVSNSTNFE